MNEVRRWRIEMGLCYSRLNLNERKERNLKSCRALGPSTGYFPYSLN
jgi:hypothetical protein